MIESLLRRFCVFLARHLPKETIYANDGVTPYLERYYIFRAPCRWLPAVFLHRLCRSDDESDLHSHPWGISFSLILLGGYVEERRVGSDVVIRFLGPGQVNIIRSTDYHRIDIAVNDTWTLFLAGRKTNPWWFWNRDTGARLLSDEHWYMRRSQGLMRGKRRT